mmetsp:Transcript_7110/g.18189  ORF Transcript_7110/g.18189 Transcript_7110/m.18189 type:complete len:297 (-) Transcript_7110:204-1094(-)
MPVTEDKSRAAMRAPPLFPKFITDNFATFALISQPRAERYVFPRLLLSASHEVFGYTLAITWFITLVKFPEQIFDHPARPIIGSLNPCFGWDYAPASFIAFSFCSVNVFLTWRYAYLESVRNVLLPTGNSFIDTFSRASSNFLALASNTWLLLWLIGPNDDMPKDNDGPNMRNWTLHTGIFVAYGLASYLAALGNYLEVRYGPNGEGRITWQNTAFIITYGTVFGYLVCVYFYDLYMYEHGSPPALHPVFTQTADILWMICVVLIHHFLPREPPLKIMTEIVTDQDELAELAALAA